MTPIRFATLLLALSATLLAHSLLSQPASAQPALPNFLTDPATGCKIAGSRGNSVSWSGGCVDGFAQGRGTARWTGPNNLVDQFEGDMRGGQRHGRGVFLWISGSQWTGDRYDGDFLNNKFHGRGVYLWKNGNRYDGEWRNNDFNGHGTMQWATNGDRYVGEWQNDRAHGQGTKTMTDGRSYTGVWNNGCFRQGDRWATAGATAEECGFK